MFIAPSAFVYRTRTSLAFVCDELPRGAALLKVSSQNVFIFNPPVSPDASMAIHKSMSVIDRDPNPLRAVPRCLFGHSGLFTSLKRAITVRPRRKWPLPAYVLHLAVTAARSAHLLPLLRRRGRPGEPEPAEGPALPAPGKIINLQPGTDGRPLPHFRPIPVGFLLLRGTPSSFFKAGTSPLWDSFLRRGVCESPRPRFTWVNAAAAPPVINCRPGWQGESLSSRRRNCTSNGLPRAPILNFLISPPVDGTAVSLRRRRRLRR